MIAFTWIIVEVRRSASTISCTVILVRK